MQELSLREVNTVGGGNLGEAIIAAVTGGRGLGGERRLRRLNAGMRQGESPA
jgi:hypothetical protein